MPQYSGLRKSAFYNRICQLPEHHQWAITELYRAATSMHFFIACHQNRDESSYIIDFNSKDWRRLIPTRNPSVRTNNNNLPLGCVSRLFTPAHRFQEIHRNVTTIEASLFNLADGERSIDDALTIMTQQYAASIDENEMRHFYSDMYDLEYLWYHGSPR